MTDSQPVPPEERPVDEATRPVTRRPAPPERSAPPPAKGAPRAGEPVLAWRQQVLARLGRESAPAEDRRLEGVRRALDQLTSDQRELLRLRYHEELPWARVAERLGISDSAARVRGSRALRTLREFLGAS